MIHVIATVQVQSGKRAEFLTEFHQVVPAVRAEVGCIEYGPTIDANSDIGAQRRLGDEHVVIIERWETLDALKAHLVAPHMAAYRERVRDLVVGTDLQVLQTA